MSDMKMLVIGLLIGICLGLGAGNLCHSCCEHHAKCCNTNACPAPMEVNPSVRPKIGAAAPE